MTAIVLDANFLVALVTQHSLRDSAYKLMESWINSNKLLHTPYLALYEVNSALTKLVWASQLSQDDLPLICQALSDLPINYHPPAIEPRITEIALVLSRKSAYDAVYLALAETLDAKLWTLDGPLYRNAIAQGFPINLLSDFPGTTGAML